MKIIMCVIILSRNASFKNSFLFNPCNKAIESERTLDHLISFKNTLSLIHTLYNL